MNPVWTSAHYAEATASIFSLMLMSEQFCFMLYHYNSYANNPVMLRSPKPMVMRDVFLTKANTMFPNPLSCLYVTTLPDCFINCAMSYLMVHPICVLIGWRHCLALYFGSGLMSSFAYLFASQVNKNKVNTKFDCTATSNGAYAGFATLSFVLPNCHIPWSKRAPVAAVGVAYMIKCTYAEYIKPAFIQKRVSGEIELRNWGFVGGAFFGLIYASLFLRTKADFGLMRKFYTNIAKKSTRPIPHGAAPGARTN